MIKTVFFDIGNVLLYFSYQKMCEQIGEVCGLSRDEVHQHLIENKFGERHETGQVSSNELFEHFQCHSSRSLTQEKFFLATCAIFSPNYSIWPVVEYDPASDVWTEKSKTPVAVSMPCTNAVNGKIYVIGGLTHGDISISKVFE